MNKKYFLAVPFVFLQLLNNCNSQNSLSIKGFIVDTKFPQIDTIINNRWDVREYTPTITRIYYYKEEVLIQQSYSSAPIEIIDDLVVKRDSTRINYYSFIFSENSLQGVYFDSNNLTTARLLNKDSVLKNISVLNDNLKETFETTHYKLTSKEVQTNGDLVEEYSLISKFDSTMTGSCLLRFSGKNSQSEFYQISPYIENKRKMRLIEFNVVNNARSFGDGKPGINRFELPLTVRDLQIDNEEEIKQMFNYAREQLK